MVTGNLLKIKSILQLYDAIPEHERIILDVLRAIVAGQLPSYCKEKISYQVPFFYGHKGICIIWPAAIPRGGFKKGVLHGFWYGNQLTDADSYLTHGNNKQIFYKIYNAVEEINVKAVIKLLQEAIKLDGQFGTSKKRVEVI